MNSSLSIPRILTLVVQTVTVLLSLWLLFHGQIFGLLLLIPVLFVDYILKSCRKDTISTAIKLLLLLQGIVCVYIMSGGSITNNFDNNIGNNLVTTKNLFNQEDNVFSKTHNNIRKDQIEFGLSKDHDHGNSASASAPHTNNRHDMPPPLSSSSFIPPASVKVLTSTFGELPPPVSAPDLKYRSSSEVRKFMSKVFSEMPNSFDSRFKNPCWIGSVPGKASGESGDASASLVCLPFAYVLGQPKSGTSDLFERLKKHPEIKMPRRKEVRWFTRGEFATSALQIDSGDSQENGGFDFPRGEKRLGPSSSVYSFTSSFEGIAKELTEYPDSRAITIDGGPHTLWWPTQNADGSPTEDIPAPQIIREMQPNAKFLLTLTDPVQRMYSDYYFLDDNLRPVRPGQETTKSAQQFHERCVSQVEEMKKCISIELANLGNSNAATGSGTWLRAAQICAHDRHKFAVGGWGRLSIGLYSLYLEKWLEHFPPDQFLVVRLEDYELDPRPYMQKIFHFLGLSEPDYVNWQQILTSRHANEHKNSREPILQETEDLLRNFYLPYNEMLEKLLSGAGEIGADRFLWTIKPGYPTLHEKQLMKPPEDSSSLDTIGGMKNRQTEKDLAIKARKMELLAEHAIHDQHGAMRNLHSPPADLLPPRGLQEPSANENPDAGQPKQLRGGIAASESFLASLKPKSFSLEGLPRAEDRSQFNEWLRDGKVIARDKEIKDDGDAARGLCTASFAMDLAALEYLLYEVGVPPNSISYDDASRNAFHCLAFIHMMGDGHARSQIYSTLKGKPSWLNAYIDPPLELQLHSVMARDIVGGLDKAVYNASLWLKRAGVDPNLKDLAGNTPLILAAVGGLASLTKLLISMDIDLDAVNNEKRSALHYAAANGHAEVVSILLEAGADSKLVDKYNVAPIDMIINPGPIAAADAKKYLNITQRPVRRIERILHPESHPNATGGWLHGSGGWGEERLKGYEEDMNCDVDQYWADEISGHDIFHKYIARSTPILIRGLINNWPANKKFEADQLIKDHGDFRVLVSDIPYAQKYGGAGHQDMTLREYIEEMREHKLVGGNHPWYVFKGHPIPMSSEGSESLVPYDDCPTPDTIASAFEMLNPPTSRGKVGRTSREIFINAQWALGGEGTGAPVHFHNTAWNSLIYGAKKWQIYPPHYMIMSNKQILDFVETDRVAFEARGVPSLTCMQTAGDTLIIPESWGHGVLNTQEAVAIATESKMSLWRIKPATGVISRLPNDNRKDYKL